jgi:hypothetical protein
MFVTLNKHEMAFAAHVGETRQRDAVARKLKPKYGMTSDPLQAHIDGARGEYAFCKAWNIHWPATVNNFSGADVGDKVQIRTRMNNRYELYVRPLDNEKHIWVLMRANPPHYEYVGWMYGRDAKKDEWLKTHGNRPPAHFVPNEELEYELPKEVFDLLPGVRRAA